MRNIRTTEEELDDRSVITYKWSCPVSGCSWSHCFICEGMTAKELMDLHQFGQANISATPEQAAKVSAGFTIIRKHLEGHSDEEIDRIKGAKP